MVSTELHCSVTTASSNVKASSDDKQRQATILKMQQKLFLLVHASTCPHGMGDLCPNQHRCHAMKRLYLHIVTCGEGGDCFVPGCRKAKKLWRHHTSCTNEHCIICTPVRISKSSSDTSDTSYTSHTSEWDVDSSSCVES